ncbi:MAG TPA: patatin-like phospholipase RssA [Rhodocyclaceae bacterium]|nr:patatin-like phospholipase RssA [Rhodocyclaceae bacterium]
MKIGLALGSGAARGWAHIGVIRALEDVGYKPDIIVGCSIGAFVGAACASNELDMLEQWVGKLTWQDVLKLLDPSWAGGLIKGEKLIDFFRQHFLDHDFSALDIPFACVATDLANGREVWLKEGSVADAVRASIAMPGLFTPVERNGRLLVDGGLVNPVPVSLCRYMGADIVIAVDLGADLAGRALRREEIVAETANDRSWLQRLRDSVGLGSSASSLPSMMTVMSSSINIMQVRIARSRLAGEPADVLLTPLLSGMGLMDYHRGPEAIAEGRAAVERMLPALEFALKG